MGEHCKTTRTIRWAALLALVAFPARAEAPPAYELSVARLEGAGSCPDRTYFQRGVAARLGRVPFAEPAERTIETVLSRRGDGWHAEITLRDAQGIELGRRGIDATGPDCGPLAQATTLALALTIDPDAALGVPGTGPPPEPSPVAPSPLSPPPCPERACPAAAPCPRAVCPVPPERPYLAASARAILAMGLIPGPAPGVALVAEGGSRTLRGELGLLFLPEKPADDARFAFGLTSAAAGACAALPPLGRLELGLCGEIQLGALHAVVHELSPVDPGDQLWLAASLGPRVALDVWSPLTLEVGISAVAPLLDRTFDVAGIQEPVFRPASVGAVSFLGVGIRTP
jgi:hypothetical protein